MCRDGNALVHPATSDKPRDGGGGTKTKARATGCLKDGWNLATKGTMSPTLGGFGFEISCDELNSSRVNGSAPALR